MQPELAFQDCEIESALDIIQNLNFQMPYMRGSA